MALSASCGLPFRSQRSNDRNRKTSTCGPRVVDILAVQVFDTWYFVRCYHVIGRIVTVHKASFYSIGVGYYLCGCTTLCEPLKVDTPYSAVHNLSN